VSIRQALLRELPIGSRDTTVIAYLARRRILEDTAALRTDYGAGEVPPGPLEKWHWYDSRRVLVLNVAYDPRQLCLVCWDFNVAFVFDDARRLTETTVHEGLTAL
jgi:hypothetical protein